MSALLWSGDVECAADDMAWTTRRYSRPKVDEAGRILIEPSNEKALLRALSTTNTWRSLHNFPLNTFQVTLRKNADYIDKKSIVAQRIKRLSSIETKLRRFDWLTLSEMQDIGGCRAVVGSVSRVHELEELYRESNIKHELVDSDDYIKAPKKSGYRGVHLIYKYRSDRKKTYNGLKIEMQFRSPLQHAWATAVETVGTFVRQALKSSRGEPEWLRFFSLMGSVLALREGTAPVPNTPEDPEELRRELLEVEGVLAVRSRLSTYGSALRTIGLRTKGARAAHYFLMALDPKAGNVTVTGYRTNELPQASKDYLATERRLATTAGAEAVLVSVESTTALTRAYPNYFLDTRLFLRAVERAIQ